MATMAAMEARLTRKIDNTMNTTNDPHNLTANASDKELRAPPAVGASGLNDAKCPAGLFDIGSDYEHDEDSECQFELSEPDTPLCLFP